MMVRNCRDKMINVQESPAVRTNSLSKLEKNKDRIFKNSYLFLSLLTIYNYIAQA